MGLGLLPLANPLSVPLGASHWNCLVGANPHLSALCQPLLLTGVTILGLLLTLVGFLVRVLPFHFSGLFLCSIPSPLFSDSPLICWAVSLVASQSTTWPFGPFALPSFSTMLPGYSVGLTDPTYSPLFHS